MASLTWAILTLVIESNRTSLGLLLSRQSSLIIVLTALIAETETPTKEGPGTVVVTDDKDTIGRGHTRH